MKKTSDLIVEMLGCEFCRVNSSTLNLKGKSSADAVVSYSVDINPCPVHLGKITEHIAGVK